MERFGTRMRPKTGIFLTKGRTVYHENLRAFGKQDFNCTQSIVFVPAPADPCLCPSIPAGKLYCHRAAAPALRPDRYGRRLYRQTFSRSQQSGQDPRPCGGQAYTGLHADLPGQPLSPYADPGYHHDLQGIVHEHLRRPGHPQDRDGLWSRLARQSSHDPALSHHVYPCILDQHPGRRIQCSDRRMRRHAGRLAGTVWDSSYKSAERRRKIIKLVGQTMPLLNHVMDCRLFGACFLFLRKLLLQQIVPLLL